MIKKQDGAPEETVTMVLDKPVHIFVSGEEGHHRKEFEPGIQEIPISLSNHPHMTARGARIYDVKKIAKDAELIAAKIKRDATISEARSKLAAAVEAKDEKAAKSAQETLNKLLEEEKK
jgi:hypothetical protein